MSFVHMAAAMHSKIGDPLAKLLLIALADRADKDTGQCWPSIARLCEDTEMSRASVTRRLIKLEEQGLIKRQQRDQKSTLYTLSLTETSLSLTETTPSLSQRHEPVRDNISKNQKTVIANELFEEWWVLYPKKVGKGYARKAYEKALEKRTHAELMAAADVFAKECIYKEGRFIPHPSTWLNGERWLDEDEGQSPWGDI